MAPKEPEAAAVVGKAPFHAKVISRPLPIALVSTTSVGNLPEIRERSPVASCRDEASPRRRAGRAFSVPVAQAGLWRERERTELNAAQDAQLARTMRSLREARRVELQEEGTCEALQRNMKNLESEKTELVSSLQEKVRSARSEQLVAEEQRNSLMHELCGMKATLNQRDEARQAQSEMQLSRRFLAGDLQRTVAALVAGYEKDQADLQVLQGLVERDRCEYNALTSHLQTFERMLHSTRERTREPLASLERLLDPDSEIDTEAEGNGLRIQLRLEQELEADRRYAATLKEEMAGEEAQFRSKSARLQELLKRSSESHAEAEDEIVTMREQLTEHNARHSLRMQQLSSELRAATSELEAKEDESEALRERLAEQAEKHKKTTDALNAQLFGANEAKRIADARLVEFKREMKVAEGRFKDTVQRMQQDKQTNEAVKPTDTVSEVSEVTASTVIDEMRASLRATIEERNLLQHTLEWKAVDFESKIEEMDRQCKASNMQKEKHHESQILSLKQEHKTAVEALQKKLALAKQDAVKNEQALQDVRTSRCEPSGWSLLFSCPARKPIPQPASTSGGAINGYVVPQSQSQSTGGLHFCQEICWRIVSSISDTISLLCKPQGLTIQQASKAATAFWTADVLMGRSVLNLLRDVTRAPWLRKAISTNQSLVEQALDRDNAGAIPGFAMHQIGSEMFKTQESHTTRFRILCVHLPPDPQRSRSAAVLIILEPAQREATDRWSEHHSGRRSKAPSGVHLRSSRSVASEDIKPGDSVSNVGPW